MSTDLKFRSHIHDMDSVGILGSKKTQRIEESFCFLILVIGIDIEDKIVNVYVDLTIESSLGVQTQTKLDSKASLTNGSWHVRSCQHYKYWGSLHCAPCISDPVSRCFHIYAHHFLYSYNPFDPERRSLYDTCRSNFLNFDYIYRKKYVQHLYIQISLLWKIYPTIYLMILFIYYKILIFFYI